MVVSDGIYIIYTTCNCSNWVSLNLCLERNIRASFLIKTGDCDLQEGKIISKNYINFDDRKIFITIRKNFVKMKTKFIFFDLVIFTLFFRVNI